jgi:ankyrin repeat protein
MGAGWYGAVMLAAGTAIAALVQQSTSEAAMTRLAFPLTVTLALIGAAPAIAQDEPPLLARQACIAVSTDQLEDLDEVVVEGAKLPSVMCGGQNLVTIAATRGSPAMLDYLAEAGVDLNLKDGEGYTPVMRALEQGRVDNALKLRDLGASLEGVTDDGYTVRVLAEVAGLDDFGPEPPGQDIRLSPEAANDILLKAAELGDTQSVRLALESGADVSAKASNGWTPVMVAALAGRADIVALLAERGALGPSDEPLDKVGDHVDAIVAALVGKGNGDPAAIDAILTTIIRHKDVSADNDYYRAVAARQGHYVELIDHYFPASDLPRLELDLPLITANDRDSWAKVQRALADKGLYQGTIDGTPGLGTFSALVGYLAPFEELLLRRSITAMQRTQNLRRVTGSASSRGYGSFRLRDDEAFGQIRMKAGNAIGAGYFGRLNRFSTKRTLQFGYFDPTTAADAPVIEGQQGLAEDDTIMRRLELKIAGGEFVIIRELETTQAMLFSYDGAGPKIFRWKEINEPLSEVPLPGANLMDKIEPLGSYSIILNATEPEPDGNP